MSDPMLPGGGALFYNGSIIAGNLASWKSAGILQDAGIAPNLLSKIFYVSASGNNSNDGLTPSSAWASISKVNSSTFAPGSSILFEGGQTFAGAIVAPNGGTPSNPITFGSYGNGKSTISSGTSNGFTATNLGGITVRDLAFTGSASSNRGIFFSNTTSGNVHYQNIKVIDCDVSGYGLDGILITGSVTYGGYDDVTVYGCTATSCCSVANAAAFPTAGIGVFSSTATGSGLVNGASFNDVVVQNCTSNNNVGATATTASGYGIVVAQTRRGSVYNCTADSNGASSNASNGSGPVGIIIYDAQFVNIDASTATNTGTGNNVDGIGFDLDFGCSKCTIQNCYSKSNSGPGYYIFAAVVTGALANDSCSILNNVSINDGAGASNTIRGNFAVNAATSAPLTNILVSGNTGFQSQAGTNVFMVPNSGNSAAITGLVQDNTFIISGAQNFCFSPVGPAIAVTSNRYYSAGAFSVQWNGTTYTSISGWNTATGQEVYGSLSVGDITTSNVHVTNNTNNAAHFDLNNSGFSGGKFFNFNVGGVGYNFYNDFWVYDQTDNVGVYGYSYVGGIQRFCFNQNIVVGWDNSAFATSGSTDTGFARRSAGLVEANNGTKGTLADLIARDLYTSDVSFLLRTKATLNNGAAASAATITNGPAAGNPTKWIPIDDNGTTRYIPAW